MDSQDLAGAHAHTQAPPLQWRGTSVASPPPGSVLALHSARGPAHVTLAPPFVLFCPTCPSPGEGPPANPGAGSAPSALAPWPHVPEPARFSAVRSLFPVLPLPPGVPPTLHGRSPSRSIFARKRNLISLSPCGIGCGQNLPQPVLSPPGGPGPTVLREREESTLSKDQLERPVPGIQPVGLRVRRLSLPSKLVTVTKARKTKARLSLSGSRPARGPGHHSDRDRDCPSTCQCAAARRARRRIIEDEL